MYKSWVNGQSAQSISLLDRGLAYGDGLFETILIQFVKPLLLRQHLDRLCAGAEYLRIPLDRMQLSDEISRFINEAAAEKKIDGGSQCVLKILLTRGVGGRGYQFSDTSQIPSRILQLFPFPNYPAENASSGIKIRVCETRVSQNSFLAGLKHLNRIDNVIARNEWDDPSIAEGLMLDASGMLIEGTMSNVFIVKNGMLFTPSLAHAGVAGVMRERVLQVADTAGLSVQVVVSFSLNMLISCDEIFICNSVIGIWPVTSFESQRWSVGSITKRLQALIQEQHSSDK